MNSFIVLIEHDDDAVKLEQLLNENVIPYECDVIGTEFLLYEFTISIKYKNIVNLLLTYNNIKNIDFKST